VREACANNLGFFRDVTATGRKPSVSNETSCVGIAECPRRVRGYFDVHRRRAARCNTLADRPWATVTRRIEPGSPRRLLEAPRVRRAQAPTVVERARLPTETRLSSSSNAYDRRGGRVNRGACEAVASASAEARREPRAYLVGGTLGFIEQREQLVDVHVQVKTHCVA
jgi:hypothetical protein